MGDMTEVSASGWGGERTICLFTNFLDSSRNIGTARREFGREGSLANPHPWGQFPWWTSSQNRAERVQFGQLLPLQHEGAPPESRAQPR